MKILHVIDSLSASGGAEHGMVREIVRFSADKEQAVVRLFANDALESDLVSRGIGVHPLGLNSSRSGWNWPVAIRRLGGVVADFQPDVVQSSLFASNVVAQVAARRAAIPILSTFTLSGDPHLLKRYQPGAQSKRAAALRKVAGVAARADLVRFRALTEDARDTNSRLLGIDPSRVQVIPRGVPNMARPDPVKTRPELGLPVQSPILLNVGRQTAQKGHVSLLEAFVAIRREVDAHLVILGRSGDTSAHLRDAIGAHDLEAHVTVIDYTPDVAHYLSHASVFVFPSFMEGLGTAVIEALAFGVPVVAFDIPPVREATGEGRYARLVPTGDTVGLAREALAALDDKTKGAGEGAASWARERYSIESVARQVESLLEAVASE